jgi:hypothetical protein
VKLVSNAIVTVTYSTYGTLRNGKAASRARQFALHYRQQKSGVSQNRDDVQPRLRRPERTAGRQSSEFSGLGGMRCDGMGCDAQASSYSGCGVQYVQEGMYSDRR